MNPWLINPPWMHYSSAVREAAISESEPDGFLKYHHRTAALYFGISFIEAFLNRKMRQVMEARGSPEAEVFKTLRGSAKFREKLKKWPVAISKKDFTISGDLIDTLVSINEVRGDITHAKTSGISEYEKLEAIDLPSFLTGVAEYAVQLYSSMGEMFPYWLLGWNYVNPHQSSPLPWVINDQQFVHSLAYLGVRINSFDAETSIAWRKSNMAGVEGYRRLKGVMSTLEPCEPIDLDFPYRPRLCRRWWDLEFINKNSRTCVPRALGHTTGSAKHAALFITPMYVRKAEKG